MNVTAEPTPLWLRLCQRCKDTNGYEPSASGPDSINFGPCFDCHGTRLRFPMLSTECQAINHHRLVPCIKPGCAFGGGHYHADPARHRRSCQCNGTGRQEITGPGAVAAYWAAFASLPKETDQYPKTAFMMALEQQCRTAVNLETYQPMGMGTWIYWWGHLTPEQQLGYLRSALEAAEVAGG